MKLIVAIIKPHKLDEVRDALIGAGVTGMTITESQGFGRQKGHKEIYRGAEYETNYVPKIRLETVVPDDAADGAVEAIANAARTDSIGDGKIFTLEVGSALRIRTGEQNDTAL